MTTRTTYTVDEALQKLRNFCAYQERCHKEVVQKLGEMEMIDAAVNQIVVSLISDNFLNEERFAFSYARGKFSQKHYGKIRIQRELKLRDIHPKLIQKALDQIDSTDFDDAFEVLADKKWESLKNENVLVKKKKFFDYMVYRGWETERIYDKLRSLSSR
ncbi:MAG: regulatory protein RecX [Bacteroidetes bacterium]|nr:regulatory protein RecX [Bacteroidota bacterium]MDA0879792.1 regulatory protein RecX [Bacteroidota bacterium]MDA1115780.1 regulatory protein RecX [Bacteroidota bacterium]